jgi:hypothetical protein
MRTRAAILLAMLLAGCASMSQPPPPGSLTTDSADFTVEAHPATRNGRAMVEGYVYNKRSWRATRVLLRVESLDAAGAVLATGVRHLDREVPFGDRVYFEVPAPVAAPAYRVTVDYVFWRDKSGV